MLSSEASSVKANGISERSSAEETGGASRLLLLLTFFVTVVTCGALTAAISATSIPPDGPVITFAEKMAGSLCCGILGGLTSYLAVNQWARKKENLKKMLVGILLGAIAGAASGFLLTNALIGAWEVGIAGALIGAAISRVLAR